MPRRTAKPAGRSLPPDADVARAMRRLEKRWALPTLVHGALPAKVLRRLLAGALPRSVARDLPEEVFSSLAASIALENPPFSLVLAQELHDRLGWDEEPADLDAWWPVVRDRPLEALWMAALSSRRDVRREFDHLVGHCIDNFRNSPDCAPPSWEYVEGSLEIQARTMRELREAERLAAEAQGRFEAERDRLEDLRAELKRLRRENAELREARADAEKRARSAQAPPPADVSEEHASRSRELARRVRKLEKEREHLLRELERYRAGAASEAAPSEPPSAEPDDETGPEVPAGEPPLPPAALVAEDDNPRRRVLRQLLRKLYTKGKIGASHTHEDNVFRGVPDHEKGVAKTAMDLLYREGVLVPKPTTTDPHVSLNPERLPEVRDLIGGRIDSPRLSRFVEE